ncbi:unnamed protein product [Owenia fusiformis]|uniref:Protein phosphatase n=1 Tax=Owenia fusiformis TaxID=6347 RepID=A0A8J1TND4_OWEFU|nr:unnamed protein product [Owenia fusiformis]
MQSVVLYGRLVARAVWNGFSNELTHQKQNSKFCSTQPQPLRNLQLVSATAGFAKSITPSQVQRRWIYGDDACFIASHKSSDVLGVADGVGGWRNYGIDPSVFPQSFMLTCERIVKEGRFIPNNPQEIMASGYAEVLQNKMPMIGSCTACIVALHKEEETLYTSNLGDSGFLVCRDGEFVHRSEEQQHYFNTPYQLAAAPPSQQGLVLSDSPESAESSSFNVQQGDIILVGTDGLFDNMTDEMILEHLRKLKDRRRESIQHTANRLAECARDLSFDPDYMSPFSMNAEAHGIEGIKGGKPDDITVVLATVDYRYNDGIT